MEDGESLPRPLIRGTSSTPPVISINCLVGVPPARPLTIVLLSYSQEATSPCPFPCLALTSPPSRHVLEHLNLHVQLFDWFFPFSRVFCLIPTDAFSRCNASSFLFWIFGRLSSTKWWDLDAFPGGTFLEYTFSLSMFENLLVFLNWKFSLYSFGICSNMMLGDFRSIDGNSDDFPPVHPWQ